MSSDRRPPLPAPTRSSILVRSLESLHRETILWGYVEAAHLIACARTSIEEEMEKARLAASK